MAAITFVMKLLSTHLPKLRLLCRLKSPTHLLWTKHNLNHLYGHWANFLQSKKGSSTKRSELQRIRERREGKSCLIWVFSSAKARKIQSFFTNRRLILASVYNWSHVRKNNDFGLHRLKTLAPVHRSNNISKCSYSSSYFLSCRLQCFIQSWC